LPPGSACRAAPSNGSVASCQAFQLGGSRSPIRVDERELEKWLYSKPGAPRHGAADTKTVRSFREDAA
jgi:hypothetical protein